jgi:hypothetical protein
MYYTDSLFPILTFYKTKPIGKENLIVLESVRIIFILAKKENSQMREV